MNETQLTIVGNLTDDPVLRYLPDGKPLCNFSLANNPRRKDPKTGEWRDSAPLFLACTAWNALAENIAASLHKGQRVVVTGRLRMNQWTTDSGDKRSGYTLDVEDLGASLLFAEVAVTKTARTAAARSS